MRYKEVVKKISVPAENKIKQKQYIENGRLPVIDQGSKLIGGYSDDEEKIVKCNLPVIVFGDHTKCVKYVNFPFCAGADGIKVLKPKEDCSEKYLYYLTKYVVLKIKDHGYARHYQYVEKEEVYIPSLNEQARIVSRIEEVLVKVERHKDETLTLYLGKSIKYILGRDKQTLKYTFAGNLNERIRDLRFIMDVFDTKCLTVNGVDLSFSPTKKEIESFDIDAARGTLKYYKLIKEMLDILHVSIPLDMDKLTEKQEDLVKMLINTIVYKKSAGFKEKGQIPPVVSLEISNIHLLLFFGQRSDGLYDVRDFFGYDINCKLDGRGDYPTTQYCIMNKRDYAYSSNIIIEKIRASFMKYDNQGHRERMVFSILEMIKAYDLSKKEELLEVALELCKWLEDKEPENSVHVINRIQCEIRLREISDTEIAELMAILQTDID